MIRTDKLYQWAPTQMAMAHEPGQVLDDEQIEAAHAATDIGADDGQPTRQAVPEGGAFAVLLVAAICCCLVALHFYARSF